MHKEDSLKDDICDGLIEEDAFCILQHVQCECVSVEFKHMLGEHA